jgi:nitrate reductase beta subunit
VYRFVKQWGIALPLTPQFRTLPMLFYVPPLLPVLARVRNGRYDIPGALERGDEPIMSSLEQARLPLKYMASLFAAGNEKIVEAVYRKLIAVRIYMRSRTAKDVPEARVREALAAGNTNPEEAQEIFRLTALATYEEHFVIPPFAREKGIEATVDPGSRRQDAGFGFRKRLDRGR